MAPEKDEIAIRVQNVSKTFKLPHEKKNSLKGAFLSSFKKKNYELQHAVKDVSFEVKKGEFFGIVGRNGSGKSTLLKCMAGVYTPSKGQIHINGSLVPFIELGVGFNPELSGRDNVFLNGALLGFSRKQMEDMYDDIVDFAELEQFMDQKLNNYSSGMQVRLAFSIAIRAQSDILLLDEVLAVGDSAFQQKCNDYFEKLKSERKTIILVTHSMEVVKRFCSRALMIDNGKIQMVGTPTDIANMYLQENIEESQRVNSRRLKNLSTAQSVVAKTAEQTDQKIVLNIAYESEDNEDMYVGISILKDGISIAELTTPLNKKLKGNGSVQYVLDTTQFNSGVYSISAALCGFDGRRLLAVNKNDIIFKVGGYDVTRGAALKLPDVWTYSKH